MSLVWKPRRFIPLCSAILLCTTSFAANGQAEITSKQSFPQVWLNPGIYSRHFDSGKGLRSTILAWVLKFGWPRTMD